MSNDLSPEYLEVREEASRKQMIEKNLKICEGKVDTLSYMLRCMVSELSKYDGKSVIVPHALEYLKRIEK